MGENPKCWARALGDCNGPITREHLFPTTVWELPSGTPNTRENRVKRLLRITDRDASGERVRDITAQNHVVKVLCAQHNGATGDLDAEAGLLAEAFRDFFDTHKARVATSAKKWKWHRRKYGVSGPLIERWLMKLAINHLVSGHMPIGAADAEPGMPSPSLVRMIYGLEPVPRDRGIGMFGVEHSYNAGDAFELSMISRADTHVSAFIVSHGPFHLGVHFESRELKQSQLDVIPMLRGGRIQRPLMRMNSGATNVEIRFAW